MSSPSPQTRLMWSAHWLSSRKVRAAMRQHVTVSMWMCTKATLQQKARTVDRTTAGFRKASRPAGRSVSRAAPSTATVPPPPPPRGGRRSTWVGVRLRGEAHSCYGPVPSRGFALSM